MAENNDRSDRSDTGDVVFRRALAPDAQPVTEVLMASFRHAYPDWPPVHTPDENLAWVRGHLIPEVETWVALEPDGTIVAVIALDGEDIDQLYVRPDRLGRGIGSRFVALAKAQRPDGLGLYTFQINARARSFYEHHGFTVERLGDGTMNEEHQPDVRYVWRPPETVAAADP